MPSDIDLLPNDPLVQGEALEAEAAGEKYFEYFYGLQVIKSSQGVLCGSLTQLARQTLSIAYGQSLPQEKWPQGRPIGSQHLLEIVWCGRNHCLHFEEKPHTRTLACLEKLEQDFGDAFPYSQKPRESLAIELIAILGWTSPIIYAQDIKSLLPPRVTMKTAI